jgi:hypothetical protein
MQGGLSWLRDEVVLVAEGDAGALGQTNCASYILAVEFGLQGSSCQRALEGVVGVDVGKVEIEVFAGDGECFGGVEMATADPCSEREGISVVEFAGESAEEGKTSAGSAGDRTVCLPFDAADGGLGRGEDVSREQMQVRRGPEYR